MPVSRKALCRLNLSCRLWKSQSGREAIGEIETEHPGYFIAQASFDVGNMKGVGRIYQQTVIDTCSKVAFAERYDRKNALIAADMLNDHVIPFIGANKIPVLRVLTDRGSEFCGNREPREYEPDMDLENQNQGEITTNQRGLRTIP